MKYNTEYKTLRTIERKNKKTLTVYDKEEKMILLECEYFKMRQKKEENGITISIQ